MDELQKCKFFYNADSLYYVQLTQQSRESGVQTQLARNWLSVHRDLRASPKFLESKSPENHVHKNLIQLKWQFT
jgi:hypothetical protein